MGTTSGWMRSTRNAPVRVLPVMSYSKRVRRGRTCVPRQCSTDDSVTRPSRQYVVSALNSDSVSSRVRHTPPQRPSGSFAAMRLDAWVRSAASEPCATPFAVAVSTTVASPNVLYWNADTVSDRVATEADSG